MERHGYKVKREPDYKYITFTTPDGIKCRDNKLFDERFLKNNMELYYAMGGCNSYLADTYDQYKTPTHKPDANMLFKRLYEDNVTGRISDEQFRFLSSDYNEEQADIRDTLPILEKQIAALKNQAGGAEQFVALARKYTKITELTPEILNTTIDKIIIGERENRHSKKDVKQKIRILFKGFGELDELMCI